MSQFGLNASTGRSDSAYLKGTSVSALKDDLLQRSRQGARTIREMDNRINLNWYMGRPWYRRLPDTARVIGLNPDRRQNFVYANMAFEVVRTLSGVMFYQPSMEAAPRTVDQEDVMRAHVARDIANASIENGKLGRAYRQVLTMANMCGHGWIKACWNPLAGQRNPVVRTQICGTCKGQGVIYQGPTVAACPTCRSQGTLYAPTGPVPAVPGYINKYLGLKPEGDVTYMAVHPDDVWTDPDAENPGESEELIHAIRMSPETAWRVYGEPMGIPFSVFENAPKANTLWSSYDTANYVGLMRPSETKYGTILEYYRRPTEKHPEGIFAVFAGEVELFSGPLPYLHDRQFTPLHYFPMYEVPGVYYPVSTLDLVMPMIVAFNDHLSAKHSRARVEAKLRMMYPVDSHMRVDDQTGHLVYKDRPGRNKPEPVALAPYSQAAESMQEVLVNFIERLSGATEITRGSAPDADSARALTFLEERALGPLKPIMADHSERLDGVIKYGLDLCRLFYSDGRMIRRTGETGGVEIMQFAVENVGEDTDVKIKTVRDVGRSRAAKMEELNEAFKLGAIDQQMYLRLSEFGDFGKVHDERRPHEDLAVLEQHMLESQGQMPSPTLYQNHQCHKEIHSKKLSAMQVRNPLDPNVPYMIQHIQQHTMLEAQEAVAVQMAQKQAAASYGMANAADPNAQPQAALDASTAANPQMETFNNAAPAPAGQAPAYQEAVDASAELAQPVQG